MAKKKAQLEFPPVVEQPVATVVAPVEPVEQKLGQGKKRCVHCGAVIGARSATCPLCQKPIPPKEKAETPHREPRTSSSGSLDLLLKVAQLASHSGGLDKLLETTEAIEELGGSRQVLEAIVALTGLKNLDL